MCSLRCGTAILIVLLACNAYAGEQIAEWSEASLPMLNETLRKLQEETRRAPTTYFGTAAPTTTPQRKGDMFIDTTAHKVYVSDGTDSSTNWRILN